MDLKNYGPIALAHKLAALLEDQRLNGALPEGQQAVLRAVKAEIDRRVAEALGEKVT